MAAMKADASCLAFVTDNINVLNKFSYFVRLLAQVVALGGPMFFFPRLQGLHASRYNNKNNAVQQEL